MATVIRTLVVSVVVAVTAACGTSSYTAMRGDRDILTRDQLLEVSAVDVYDAVKILRPDWLSSRGPASISDDPGAPPVASVYMNGNLMGDATVLRDIRLEDIDSLRYFQSGAASARFGMGHPRGVIEVYPRSGDRY